MTVMRDAAGRKCSTRSALCAAGWSRCASHGSATPRRRCSAASQARSILRPPARTFAAVVPIGTDECEIVAKQGTRVAYTDYAGLGAAPPSGALVLVMSDGIQFEIYSETTT
jgi:hypothetical protein